VHDNDYRDIKKNENNKNQKLASITVNNNLSANEQGVVLFRSNT